MQYIVFTYFDPYAGRLLTALICEYLDWASLNHTLKVYLPECNLVLFTLLSSSCYFDLTSAACFMFQEIYS